MRPLLFGLLLGLLFSLDLPAQAPPATEDESLRQALAESLPNPAEFIRVLESHLAKYPNSPRRAELEQEMAKAALEAKDDRRIVLYGERVLARQAGDVPLLEGVARALLASTDKDAAARALKYAGRLEADLRKSGQAQTPGGVSAAAWREEIDRELGKALLLQARADSNLGQADDALRLARRSFDAWPIAEAAREIARILASSGQIEEAIRRYADAFTIPDATATDSERASDRAHMGQLYLKLKGSQAGLGDLVLEAYDRTAALVAGRQSELRQLDPNAHLSDPMEFTLSGLDGGKLALSSLRGKVLVLDFWATWCGPCRYQYPLFEEVKKRFKDRSDVVFLSINGDDDRAAVAGFVAKYKWDRQAIYFDDGLLGALDISMLPLTVVIGKQGRIESRLGFIPDRFVEMLSSRIRQASGNP
jgi:thiol-disulfide isomerase/thioredoxin